MIRVQTRASRASKRKVMHKTYMPCTTAFSAKNLLHDRLMNTPTNYHSTAQAAKALHISPATLQRWAREGRINPEAKTAGGHARWSDEQIEQLRAQMTQGSLPSLPETRDARIDAIAATVSAVGAFVLRYRALLLTALVCIAAAAVIQAAATSYYASQGPVFDPAVVAPEPGYRAPEPTATEQNILMAVDALQLVAASALLTILASALLGTYRSAAGAFVRRHRRLISATAALALVALVLNSIASTVPQSQFTIVTSAADVLALCSAGCVAAAVAIGSTRALRAHN